MARHRLEIDSLSHPVIVEMNHSCSGTDPPLVDISPRQNFDFCFVSTLTQLNAKHGTFSLDSIADVKLWIFFDRHVGFIHSEAKS